MIRILESLLIDKKNLSPAVAHRRYGILSGFLGIFFNLLLFAGKLTAGLISGSIAIMADAMNNLSDAASSVTTLVCFKLAGQRPDSDHPFGHGRYEYIAGLIVSMVIFIMGFELGKSSVEKILDKTSVEYSITAVIILISSVCVKFYMYFYNLSFSKKTGSLSLKATAMDSISDCVATTAVLFSMLFAKFTNLNIDGYCGLLVAGFILYNGYKTIKETINPLLGQQPKQDMVAHIHSLVMSHPEVIGIHDLIIHDYGPGRSMISLHAEVDANSDFIAVHDAIDNIEHELADTLDCQAVIHMDPIVMNDEKTDQISDRIGQLLRRIDENITFHDFRIVPGPTHTKLIFDVSAPYTIKMSDNQLKSEILHQIQELKGNFTAVITIDRHTAD